MQRRGCSAGRPVRVALLIVLALLLSSCTWSRQEPGLFNGPEPSPVPSEPSPSASTRVGLANPALPTFGDAVWRTGDGTGLPVRIAVHAVRRVEGATVLDWSLTALPTPDRPSGTALPENTNLGLSRFGEGDLNVFLVDVGRHRLYRPLVATEGAGLQHCLCTPVWIAQRQLVVGVTTLMQVAFPTLPASVTAVDVDIATVPIVPQVPVTARGTTARGPEINLLEPEPEQTPITSTRTFDLLGQRFAVGVDDVIAGPDVTTVRWQITAMTSGRGLDSVIEWPLAGARRLDYASPSASGVTLRPGRNARRLTVLAATTKLRGLDQLECLCTDLRLWATGLSRAGSGVTVVSALPALSADAQTVEVALPGLSPFADVPVTRQPGAAGLLWTTVSTEPKTYTYRMDEPPTGWSVDDWPSPVPNPRQINGYTAVVDDLV